MLIDVHVRLRDDLSQRPAERFDRVTWPYDGMAYHFPLTDPSNPDDQRRFMFHVMLAADEEALVVIDGGYLKRY